LRGLFLYSRLRLARAVSGWGQAGNGRVWGTYIHGVFDADGFRRNFLGAARKAKGYARPGRVNFDTDKEFDKLACLVRRNLNMKLLYEIIGSGV
jgi:cobyric acid synthase